MKNFSNMTAKEYEKYIENQKKIERDNKIKFIEENIEEVITYILQKDIKNFKKLDVHLQKIILNQELNIIYDNKKLYKMLGFNRILSNIIDKYFDSFKNKYDILKRNFLLSKILDEDLSLFDDIIKILTKIKKDFKNNTPFKENLYYVKFDLRESLRNSENLYYLYKTGKLRLRMDDIIYSRKKNLLKIFDHFDNKEMIEWFYKHIDSSTTLKQDFFKILSFKNQKKLYNEFDFLTKLQYKKLLKGDPNEDKYTYSFDRKSDKEIIENNLQKENYEENSKMINQLKNLSDNKIIEFINSSNIIKQEKEKIIKNLNKQKENYVSKKSSTPTSSTSTNNFQKKYGYLVEEREDGIYMYDDDYEDMVYYSSKKYFEKEMEYQRKRAEEEYWMDTT